MIHSSKYLPRIFPIFVDDTDAELDRIQDLNSTLTLNRTKVQEVGRTGIVAWRKTTPSVTVNAKQFEYWLKEQQDWLVTLGFGKENLKLREHDKEELAHYSKRTVDIEYNTPFGWKEMFGLAYRTDFDLKNHAEKSGQALEYTDPETNEKLVPHVIEPTFGLTRLFLMVLLESYREEEDRVYLKLPPQLAPYKAAVFPLLKNKPELVEKAKGIYKDLQKHFNVAWDDRGNVGKRYYSQDEIGTPFCITVDFDSLQDGTVTVRNRDTKEQPRVKIEELAGYILKNL
jgi:glycyl-tRNA synthetase